MRRLTAVGLGLVMTFLFVAIAAAGAPTKFIGIPMIGIQNADLDDTFIRPEAPDEMAAFVETGSLDPGCLATLSEANLPGLVGPIYCNARQIDRDGRLMNGLALRIFFDASVPAGMVLRVNYYQERMFTNPAPIPCYDVAEDTFDC